MLWWEKLVGFKWNFIATGIRSILVVCVKKYLGEMNIQLTSNTIQHVSFHFNTLISTNLPCVPAVLS